MKRLAGLLIASVFGLMFYAAPAHAQFSGLPNEAAWNQYLANHPKTAAELRANPSLIYNAKWRSEHPHFEQWANNHPKDWEMMKSPAPWQNKYGAWDSKNNEWHDKDWWHKNNPQWAHENHPDWWQEHNELTPEQKQEAHEKAQQAKQNWQQEHHHHHDHDHDNN